MAGKDNLKRPSSEEARKNGRKGGIASGKSRRRKRLMKEQMEFLLSQPVTSAKAKKAMEGLGIDEELMDNQMALIVAMFQQGVKGNVKAFTAIRDTIGEMPVQEVNINENKKLADVVGQLGGAGLDDDD